MLGNSIALLIVLLRLTWGLVSSALILSHMLLADLTGCSVLCWLVVLVIHKTLLGWLVETGMGGIGIA